MGLLSASVGAGLTWMLIGGAVHLGWFFTGCMFGAGSSLASPSPRLSPHVTGKHFLIRRALGAVRQLALQAF